MIISQPGTELAACHVHPTLTAGEMSPVEASLADPGIRQALQVLFRAAQLAEDCHSARQEFPLDWRELQQAGISTAVLKWLTAKRLIVHSILPAAALDAQELREAARTTLPSERSWFCLSDAGRRIAAELGSELPRQVGDASWTSGSEWTWPGGEQAAHHVAAGEPSHPAWDGERHELRCGGVLIKRFKWRASNQERILAAFEEEGWPPRIDDPLPPRAEIDSKRRLGDTIKCLNRNHLVPVLRFIGDGSGQGVIWELQFARPRKSK